MAEVRLDGTTESIKRQYPSNSLTRRDPTQEKGSEKPKVEKVTKGKTYLQQENLGQKIKKMLLPGDIRDIRKYAIENVLIPGFKSGMLAMVELMLYGNVRRRTKPGLGGTDYSYISSNGSAIRSPSRTISQTDRATHNFQNVIFETYSDASNVVETLIAAVEQYGVVTVDDFYEAAGVQQIEYTDRRFGWKKFTKIEPRAIAGGGYIIDIDRPVLLD